MRLLTNLFSYRYGHKIKLTIYAIMTLAVMILIFFFSSQSGNESQRLSDGLLKYVKNLIEFLPELTDKGSSYDVRKYAHIMEYMFLGISSALFFLELFIEHFRTGRLSLCISFLFCVFYACTDEIHQFFIPERAARLIDVVFDSVGALTGILLVSAICFLIKTAKIEERE